MSPSDIMTNKKALPSPKRNTTRRIQLSVFDRLLSRFPRRCCYFREGSEWFWLLAVTQSSYCHPYFFPLCSEMWGTLDTFLSSRWKYILYFTVWYIILDLIELPRWHSGLSRYIGNGFITVPDPSLVVSHWYRNTYKG